MTRIKVTPETLQSVSAQYKSAAADLLSLVERLSRAGGLLDLEVQQKAALEERISQASARARELANQAQTLADTLKHSAERFSTADQQGVANLAKLPPAPFPTPVPTTTPKPGAWPPTMVSILPVPVVIVLGILWPPKIGFRSMLENVPSFIRDWFQPATPGKMDSTPVPTPVPAPAQPQKFAPAVPPTPQPVSNLTRPVPVKSPLGNYQVSGGSFPTYGDGTLHNGLDIAPKPYDPKKTYAVNPIGPGTVYRVDTQYQKNDKGEIVRDSYGNPIIAGYGNYVIIKHELEDGSVAYSRYAHLRNKPDLKVGDPVTQDTQIGIMGTTGRSTGEHVHLEVVKIENPTQGFWYKKPDTPVDSNKPDGIKWEERMRQDYEDPADVLSGKKKWKLITPPVKQA